VVVIDVDPLAFDRLGSGFNGETIVGDCTDRDVLEQAGVQRADGLIAVTRSDNANLMAVEIATHLYDVPRTIARLFNPEREEVYRKLGVRYVSSTGTIAKLFLNEFQDESYPLHVHFPTATSPWSTSRSTPAATADRRGVRAGRAAAGRGRPPRRPGLHPRPHRPARARRRRHRGDEAERRPRIASWSAAVRRDRVQEA
jgi:hypothetical protein